MTDPSRGNNGHVQLYAAVKSLSVCSERAGLDDNSQGPQPVTSSGNSLPVEGHKIIGGPGGDDGKHAGQRSCKCQTRSLV